MKKQFNSEDGVTTWGLDRWYEKTFYVLGFIWTILFVMAFVGAFFAEYQYQNNGIVEPNYSNTQDY